MPDNKKFLTIEALKKMFTKSEKGVMCAKNVDFSLYDLSSIKLDKNDALLFENCSFSNMYIKNVSFLYCTFRNCQIKNVDFQNCNFYFAAFKNCRFNIVTFSNCDMTNSNFVTCNINEVNFKKNNILKRTAFDEINSNTVAFSSDNIMIDMNLIYYDGRGRSLPVNMAANTALYSGVNTEFPASHLEINYAIPQPGCNYNYCQKIYYDAAYDLVAKVCGGVAYLFSLEEFSVKALSSTDGFDKALLNVFKAHKLRYKALTEKE